MSDLTILRRYALKCNPASLPASVLLTHTATSLTIFDAFPKSIFHFLILPRVVTSLTSFELANLRTLLECDRERAKAVLSALSEDARYVTSMIEDEMMKRYGFKWGVQVGFHPVPSMECAHTTFIICLSLMAVYRHLHLHVMSTDFCAGGLKHKKHYNSFHPKLGFFLHLDDVLSWFDAEHSYFSTVCDYRVLT
jgi:aprataxin